jgi:Fic family protein
LPKLIAAERALGRLDGITVLLPRQELFLYMYVRKEAVLSSQIEGTQSTLTDLLRFETEAQAGEPVDDVREVSNYVDAMMFGLERLTSKTSAEVMGASIWKTEVEIGQRPAPKRFVTVTP